MESLTQQGRLAQHGHGPTRRFCKLATLIYEKGGERPGLFSTFHPSLASS